MLVRCRIIYAALSLIFFPALSVSAQQNPPATTPGPDDIVVIGQLYPSPRIYEELLPSLTIVNGVPSFAVPSGAQTNQHVCTEKNAKREVGKDKLATSFQFLISSNYSDTSSREYAAGLIMDTTNPTQPTFRLSPITPGLTWAEATAAGLPAPQVVFNIGPLSTFEVVVGIIHNHPPIGDPNPDLNKLPSNADWSVYKSLVNSNVQTAPEYAFSSYIIGPDGKIREYRQDAGYPNRATSGINNRC